MRDDLILSALDYKNIRDEIVERIRNKHDELVFKAFGIYGYTKEWLLANRDRVRFDLIVLVHRDIQTMKRLFTSMVSRYLL